MYRTGDVRTGKHTCPGARQSPKVMMVFIAVLFLVPGLGYSQNSTGDGEGVKTILVTGATGNQGGAVARELLRRGYPVRGLTRNTQSARAQTLSDLGVEMVQGDFNDSASISRALDGVYGAFSVQNYWEHGKQAEIRQGVSFADAALAAGVSHFVFSSVAHADESTGIAHFDSKYEIENHIHSLGLQHTIFRPVAFMENWEYSREGILAGEISGPFETDTVRQQISVRDIGRFVAEAFDNPDIWMGRSLDIAGDEYDVSELLDIFTRVTGRPVDYRQVPWEAHLASEGEDMTEMDRWIDAEGYHVDLDEMRKLLPGLLSLEAYLRSAGWGKPE
jgi:uncharacterized protein YbjT (DUF2867 family)